MAAFAQITNPRETDKKDGKQIAFLLAAAKVYKGGLVSSIAGYANYTTPSASAPFLGVAMETIDNSAGSSTVTVVLDGSISVNTPAITGGDVLTVSTANNVALFRFYFVSATAAKVFRIY